jgi:predicted esterase
MTMSTNDPHGSAAVERRGAALADARAALIMIHGRGGSAADMLSLWDHIETPGIAVLAPEAVGNTWYPQRFMEPREQNEPWVGSALSVVSRQIEAAAEAGIDRERIFLLGFSQGACLATQYVAEYPERYAGVFALSGGLIGPAGSEFAFSGDLAGTPIYLGCSNVDPHIPEERVRETADALELLGGSVTMQLFEDAPHSVMSEEIEVIREALRAVGR